MSGKPRTNATTTKRDLVRVVAQEIGCPAALTLEMVDAVFEGMREQLIAGNRIEVRGFGALAVREMAAKPGARNPRTGEVIQVPSHRRIHFKPGRLLQEALHVPLTQEEEK